MNAALPNPFISAPANRLSPLEKFLEGQGFEKNPNSGTWEYGFTGNVSERVSVSKNTWQYNDDTGVTIAGEGVRALRKLLNDRFE
jgi:hypothetical protein